VLIMNISKTAVISAGLSAVLCMSSISAAAQEFGYRGEIGPDFWSTLSSDWGTCNSGEVQSPANLAPQRNWPKLDISYSDSTGEIFNNGHTVEVEITAGANTLVLDGVAYELKQFHFHSPSEHRVDGRGYDMEMHLVHASAAGTNAVIGVFLKRATNSGALGQIFAALPDIEDENVKYEVDGSFNPAAFLPRSRAHSRYVGSLTTPPCTEGVQWVVMNEVVTVSDEDMAQFGAQISFNARYTQRMVPTRPVKH
jgi:carbonic anhydrase